MADWADETAARCIMEWATQFPHSGFGRLPVSVVARALRKAKADGMREAADNLGIKHQLSKLGRERIHLAADRIERGDDA